MQGGPGSTRRPLSLGDWPALWLRYLRAARRSPRKKKPGELIYGPDDASPPIAVAFAGFQHVSLIRIQLIYPLFVIQTAGLSAASSVNMLSLALIALGFAAVLQSLPRGPIGSGFLFPS